MPNFKPELNALDPQPIGLGAMIRKPVENYTPPKEISPGIYQDSTGKLRTFFSENEEANATLMHGLTPAPAVKRVRRPATPATPPVLLEVGDQIRPSTRKSREFQKVSKIKSWKS